jgi:hypothetical protein
MGCGKGKKDIERMNWREGGKEGVEKERGGVIETKKATGRK